MPSCRGDRLRRALGVAGRHDDAQARRVQRRDGRGGARLDRVGDGDEPGRARRRRRRTSRCCPRACSASALARRARRGRAPSAIIAALPSATARPPTVPRTPLPVTDREVGGLAERQRRAPSRRATIASASGCSEPRSRLAAAASSVVLVAVERDDVGEDRLALGQRAGLVDDQRVDAGEALQRLGLADQHAGLRAAPGGDHDRHRRREPERAGAGDDQHDTAATSAWAMRRRRAEQRPGGEGEDRDGDDGRHEVAGDAVGEALDRRAGALGARRPSRRCATASSRRRPARAAHDEASRCRSACRR